MPGNSGYDRFALGEVADFQRGHGLGPCGIVGARDRQRHGCAGSAAGIRRQPCDRSPNDCVLSDHSVYRFDIDSPRTP